MNPYEELGKIQLELEKMQAQMDHLVRKKQEVMSIIFQQAQNVKIEAPKVEAPKEEEK